MAITTDMSRKNTGGSQERLDDYFGLKTGSEFIADAFWRIEQYAKHCETSGKTSTWKRAYKNRYLGGMEGARLRTGGEKNQFVMAQVNHYSNIISHIHNNVVGQRPALKARANNSDFKSLAQTKIANQVLEYYLDERGLEEVLKKAAELSLIFGEGFVEMIWNTSLGQEVAADENGEVIHEGDVELYFYSPLDVIRDYSMPDSESTNWRITRRWVNKWNLASKYKAHADDILSSTMSVSNMKRVRVGHPVYESEGDQIPLYTFTHDKGDILKDGRMVQFIESQDTILFDGPLPHPRILHRIAPEEQHGTIWGYSIAYDLLPIQENLNMLYSIIASNQAMFGVQSLLVAKGSGIEYSSLQGGLRIVEYDAKPGVDTKPSALQLTSTPKEIFEHINHLIQQMEMISGVNSVVRGQPEASLESGAALALVASQSIQFMSSFQGSYTDLMESVGTGLIDILKLYAQTPRLIAVSGKHNGQYMDQFKGEDINQVARISVEVGNPLSRTTSGKLQIAQDLLKNNLVPNAKQYLQIIETGSMEPLTESTEADLLLIKEENEYLLKGMLVPAMRHDQHMRHIQEHAAVLANVNARLNPQVVDAVDKHIRMHEGLLAQQGATDPVATMAEGQPVIPDAPAGGPPPAGGPAQPSAGARPGASPAPGAAQSNPTNPIQQAANRVKPPAQPTNPLSHQPFNPTTGGL